MVSDQAAVPVVDDRPEPQATVFPPSQRLPDLPVVFVYLHRLTVRNCEPAAREVAAALREWWLGGAVVVGDRVDVVLDGARRRGVRHDGLRDVFQLLRRKRKRWLVLHEVETNGAPRQPLPQKATRKSQSSFEVGPERTPQISRAKPRNTASYSSLALSWAQLSVCGPCLNGHSPSTLMDWACSDQEQLPAHQFLLDPLMPGPQIQYIEYFV